MTTTRMTRAAAGELVRQALLQVRPNGLSTEQLAEATNLTRSQVSNGLIWIRETAASEHLTPLTHTHADGYRFSQEPADWIEFERAQLRRMLTTLQRTLTAVADPHMALMPDDALATWMNAQFTSLSRTMEITLSPPGSSTASTGRAPAPA